MVGSALAALGGCCLAVCAEIALGGVVRLLPAFACRIVSWMCGRVACLGLREGATRCGWR